MPAKDGVLRGRLVVTEFQARDDVLDRLASSVLVQHATKQDNAYSHAWYPGDVVMWDNTSVLHRASHTDVVGDRVTHRGKVAAY